LLAALINAPAILVIVAAVAAPVAISRLNHFAENVVAMATESALSSIDLPSKDVMANLRNLAAEVRMLGQTCHRGWAGNMLTWLQHLGQDAKCPERVTGAVCVAWPLGSRPHW
jgi:hypothetical protein